MLRTLPPIDGPPLRVGLVGAATEVSRRPGALVGSGRAGPVRAVISRRPVTVPRRRVGESSLARLLRLKKILCLPLCGGFPSQSFKFRLPGPEDAKWEDQNRDRHCQALARSAALAGASAMPSWRARGSGPPAPSRSLAPTPRVCLHDGFYLSVAWDYAF